MVPLMLMVDPVLVPGPLMLSALSLNSLMVYRGRDYVDLRAFWPIVVGMIGGGLLAWPLVAYLRGPETQVVFGMMLLVAVAVSLGGWSPQMTGRNMIVAGVVSAFMGTTAAIGGPILALLFQRRSGPEMRAALAALYLAGTLIILAILYQGGRLGWPELQAGGLLIPGWLAGYWLAGPMAKRLDAGYTRIVVLTIAGVSAVLLVARGVRAFWGVLG
ncbi:sulfite exporter TauE/SafE family protein [Magnetospira thiophila]